MLCLGLVVQCIFSFLGDKAERLGELAYLVLQFCDLSLFGEILLNFGFFLKLYFLFLLNMG